jgi:hypothetical protein
LAKKTLKPSTVKRKVKTIKSLMKHGVELSDPVKVMAFLNGCSWENGTKAIAIDAYRDYLDMLGLTNIELPYFRRTEKLPFIPLESEINRLIAAGRFKMACFLRLLES